MGVWLLPILLLLLVLGMPISFAMGVTAIIGFILLDKLAFISVIPQTMFAGLNSFPILAMPFFILAGEIMNRTGITERLLRMADVLVGWLRGGLGHVDVLASVIFAGITGSAVADESALGPILIPAMVESGYHKSYAAALVAAAAVIGPIIPPSIIMVIYGALMNVSIAGMFAAGIVPGLLIAAGLMIMNYFISRKRNYPKRDTMPTFREAATSVMGAMTALLMPLIILGGILGGIFTPTESAAIAVLYSLIVGFAVFRTLTVAEVYHALVATFRLCGVILIIVSVGSVLSWLFAIDHVPEQLAKVFTALGGNNKYLIILILNIFLIIVGMFMDITAALIILAPILAPLATEVGMDPLHFGVMMCINLNIGLITPPVGACLFVATSISKLRYEEVIREVWPFILVEVGVLFLLAYIPPLTLYVPHLLGFAR